MRSTISELGTIHFGRYEPTEMIWLSLPVFVAIVRLIALLRVVLQILAQRQDHQVI